MQVTPDPEPTWFEKLLLALDDVLYLHDITEVCDVSVLDDEIIIRRSNDEPPFTVYEEDTSG